MIETNEKNRCTCEHMKKQHKITGKDKGCKKCSCKEYKKYKE